MPAKNKSKPGPKTPTGKARSAANATKHGLCAGSVLATEDPQQFKSYIAAMKDELDPVGPVETLLVNRAAMYGWRLMRAVGLESESIAHQARAVIKKAEMEEMLCPLSSAITPTPNAASSLALGSEELAKLRRYEIAAERGLFRTVRELWASQDRRKAGDSNQDLE